MKPGAYYHEGGSEIVFGMYFLTSKGKWLFSVPVEGGEWGLAEDQSGEKKIPLLARVESCEKLPGGAPCESKRLDHKVHWANTTKDRLQSEASNQYEGVLVMRENKKVEIGDVVTIVGETQ